MREIKFRAFTHSTKQMQYDVKYQFGDIIYDLMKDDSYAALMQYTGLKDKNGVEIYEGDIIYISGHGNDVVIFKDGRFCIDGYSYPNNDINHKIVEVIGNIYENEELLK